jgi:UDP-glucose 4-epimerase
VGFGVHLKVCILGVTGFLGSSIAQELTRKGIPWIGVSSNESSHPNIKTINRFDTLGLVNIIDEFPVVVNATGSLKPKDFESHTKESLAHFFNRVDFLSNVFAQSKIECLVTISSAGTVYGEGVEGVPHPETSIMKPISWYGRAKQFEEMAFEKVAEVYDFNSLCLRVSNPFGNPHRTTHGFVDVLVHCAKNDIPFSYYKDCDPQRDFVYAADMSYAIVKLISNNHKGTFNIGSGESIRLRTLIEYVQKNWLFGNFHEDLIRPDSDVVISDICVSKLKACECYVKTVDIFSFIDKKLTSIQKIN